MSRSTKADAHADGARRGRHLRRGAYIIPSLFTIANVFCGYFALTEVAKAGLLLPNDLMLAASHFDNTAKAIGFAVLFDGLDNCKEMSVLFAGLEFAARGWHTLAIDGPGQGESLRLRELYARHDYEAPGAAAYDYVASRAEVNPAKVAVMGYSFGGYYASRIAAFEKRYCAAVAMSALHWDLHAWQRDIKRRQDADPKGTPQSAFHFRWIMGHIDDAEAALEKAKKFSLKDVARNITCPFLIVHAGDDTVVPVANAPKLFEAAGSKDKHLKILSAEDGGNYHAQADNRQVGIDYIADWLEERL